MTAGVRSIFGILLALVLVSLGIYGLQNQEHIAAYFLFFTFHGTQAWIPAGVFALLILVLCLLYGVFSGTVWQFRRRRLARATSEHQSRAESLSRDLEEARAEAARLREAATRREEQRPVAEALRPDRSPERPVAADGPGAAQPPAEGPARTERPAPATQEPGARAEQPPSEPAPPSQPPPPSEEPPPHD